MSSRRRVDFEDTETFHDDAPDEVSQDAAYRQIPRDGRITVSTPAKVRRNEDGSLELYDCRMAREGLTLPAGLSLERLEEIGGFLFGMGKQVNLWIGDLLAQTDDLHYGDLLALATELGYSPNTLYKWKSVCAAVPVLLRGKIYQDFPEAMPLTMSHYQLVMALDLDEQTHYVASALENNWSVAEMRTALHGQRESRSIEQRVILHMDALNPILDKMPNEKRQVILNLIGEWLTARWYLEEHRMPH